MRVLMLGPTNSPHVEDLVVGLDERGLDVVVGGESAPTLPPSTLTERGIRVELAPPGAFFRPERMVRRVRWIRRLMREVRPDVVHAHFLVEDPFYAALAGARSLVATAWGSDVLVATGLARRRARLVARRADLLTADSGALLETLRSLGANEARLRLINWGVDLEAFSPGRAEARRRLDLPDVPIVLAPRALKPVYNPAVMVEAFGHVAREFPDALLLLKHYGPLPPELADLTRRDDVRVVGHVDAPELADYYRAANVCVSIASSDSSPRSVWEAMACGCPCVLSDLPWVHESIAVGRDALVTQIDVTSIADAIGRVLRSEELSSELAERGRLLVERHHRRSAEIDKVIDAYGEIVRP